ncbi:radical SAM protein [Flavonifractor hominis]|uniref:Radical SAM protein n=1 Tax=Flavonifractor hominis TaxID=3133178 RepID=A0ABV1EMM7_9FIRM
MSETKPQPGQEIEPRWSAYMHEKGNHLGLPVSGTFELTPRCNFGCKMCYVHQTPEQITASGRRELTAGEWLEIGEQARQAGMVLLLLTGGEPLLYPGFMELLHALKGMGLLVSVNSNGLLAQGELLEQLHRDPPMRFNITLYGGSDATYERLCGRPVFHQVVDNIRALREAGIPIRLNASITPDNREDVEDIFRVGRELGLYVKSSTYMFPPVRVNGGAAGEAAHRFTAADAARYELLCREQTMTQEQLRAAVEAGGLPPDGADCTGGGEGEPLLCRAGRSSFWLTWDGRMIPCGMMNCPGHSVTELGFRRAWEAVRADTAAIRLPGACTGCPMRVQCASCAASCAAETGRSDQRPDYLCAMTRELIHLTREKYGKRE